MGDHGRFRFRGVGMLLPIATFAALLATSSAQAGVDLVRVNKAERSMELIAGGEPVRRYPVALGANPVGHKQREGDERTPEGIYVLDWRNPASAFHKSIHISYPDADDRAAAAARGEDPGGDIMIHGQPNGWGWWGWMTQWVDWTNGCIAVTDAEMDEIWALVPDGTRIEILP